MRIFLSGLMGSGKSTLAKALAARTSLPCFDLDALLVSQLGCSIADYFAQHGEEAFRRAEAELLTRLLDEQPEGVFALGGGAVLRRDLRRRMLSEGFLVTLDAQQDELVRRLGGDGSRPLLAGDDPRARLSALRAERAPAYAECHLRLDTTYLEPERAARAVLDGAEHAPIVVPLGQRTYRVFVGQGVRHSLGERVRELGQVTSIVVVTDSQIAPHWGRGLVLALRGLGHTINSLELPPGESAKTLASVETIWNFALDLEIDRGSLLIGVGGGVVGDLTGFAAATLLRGVRVAHLPTTLLAMVDSAVGGKTGFDTRHGKNLIGAFHQPSFVVADVQVLSSLPLPERLAGLSEVVKSAWIDGEPAVAQLERDAELLSRGDEAATVRAIRMAVSLKGRIVTQDEHEQGLRAVLNLGHTLAHAIEASSGYAGIRHGEAVSLGMVAACRVGRQLGRLSDASAARLCRLLDRIGLPTQVETYLSDRVLSFISADKKRKGATVGYVVPGEPGDVTIEPLSVEALTKLMRTA